jgi:hypothetical protein
MRAFSQMFISLPVAEGGGLFLLVFWLLYFPFVFFFFFFCFQDAKLLFQFANMYFVHIAFTADGR